MRHRHGNRLVATLFAVAVIYALLFMTNPELRAPLLFTDSLGLDLLTLLLAMQLRYFLIPLLPAGNATLSGLCVLAFCAGRGAIWAFPKALPWRPFDKLLCPALMFVTLRDTVPRCATARTVISHPAWRTHDH
jgi:hypothetical protein